MQNWGRNGLRVPEMRRFQDAWSQRGVLREANSYCPSSPYEFRDSPQLVSVAENDLVRETLKGTAVVHVAVHHTSILFIHTFVYTHERKGHSASPICARINYY